MIISSRPNGKSYFVMIGEDITHNNVREFSDYLDKLIEQGSLSMVLDLSQVPYVTSRGLGAIVSTYTVLRKRGGTLIVMSPQAEVRRSLELTRLDRILEVVPDEAEAMRRLAQ